MKTLLKNNLLMAMLVVGGYAFAQQPAIPTASRSNSAVIRSNLDIINDAFSVYNAYETTFSVVGNTLEWHSSVADISGDIEGIIFYVNYDNKWIVVKCLEGECLTGTSYNEEYSMSLKTSSGSISPEMERVLNAFNAIRADVLRN